MLSGPANPNYVSKMLKPPRERNRKTDDVVYFNTQLHVPSHVTAQLALNESCIDRLQILPLDANTSCYHNS